MLSRAQAMRTHCFGHFGCKWCIATITRCLLLAAPFLFIEVLPGARLLAQTPLSATSPVSADGEPELKVHSKPIQVDVDLVLVPVSITDIKNRPVTGLGRQDFALFEGETPQQIRYFSTEEAPLSLGVVMDLSKSMKNKIASAREAVADFFATANPQDDCFVVTFADRPALLTDSTRSLADIQSKLALAEPEGHTALLDAVYLALHKIHSAQYRRRALLIISDGGDNHSRYNAKEIKKLVEEADVQIYAVAVTGGRFRTPEEWAGQKLLNEITEATGGRTVVVDNAAQLPDVAAQISQELRNQYVLGYRPSDTARDGAWRKIKVKVLRQLAENPLAVHFKRGYQAPGE